MRNTEIIIFFILCSCSINIFGQQDSSIVDSSSIENRLSIYQDEINDINIRLTRDYIKQDTLDKELLYVDSILTNQNSAIQDLQIQLKQIENSVQNASDKIDQINNSIQYEISRINNDLNNIQSKLTQQDNQFDSLSALALNNKSELSTKSENLTQKLSDNTSNLEKDLDQVKSDVSSNWLYWLLSTIILLIAGGLLYYFMHKNDSENKEYTDKLVEDYNRKMENKAISQDEKLMGILKSQLEVQKEQSDKSGEMDHSFALKVADEVTRMKKNIARMDENNKRVKPLRKGLERIRKNFMANGYEITDLLGNDYDDRMNIDVINFLQDENLMRGNQVITKIIKPQVKYNDVLIQRAKVEVSHN